MNLINKNNPRFFETMMCHCGETEELKKHKFTDEIMCVECVNKELFALEKEEASEGYYTDKNYNDLIAEREA